MEGASDIGMCASQVRIHGTETLDSAGLLLFRDGSSKQRGQGRPASDFPKPEEVLCPSASAALYRRAMLNDIGMFDKDFYLYCEDTDLGLRARRRGWRCRYVPAAVAWHHYSQSSGAASPLKVWHIERNRLWVAAKNFPISWLCLAPVYEIQRYLWHLYYLLRGQGSAAQFRPGGNAALSLIAIVLKAHWSLVARWGELGRKRAAIRCGAVLSDVQFSRLLKQHSISAPEIARL